MNTLEKSLALAKAWLDSVDDKTFYSEYEKIKEYSSVGPTIEIFIKGYSKRDVLSYGFYVKPVQSNLSPNINNLNYNVIISDGYSLSSQAVNDENYSLAA
jgi:hypothetical protein